MLSLFLGNDTDKKRESLRQVLVGFPDARPIKFDDVSFDEEMFVSLASSDDLFAEKKVVTVEDVLSTDFAESVFSRLSEMASSPNTFIFLEEKLKKAELEKFEKAGAEIKTFEKREEKKVEKFNVFSVTDAFGARDKKNTWVLLQKALRAGLLAEDVLNVLIWQAKNLCLVKGEKDIKKTGLSPFVFNKGRRYSENWSTDELEKLSSGLVTLFHESHLGLDLGPNLELFLLKNL